MQLRALDLVSAAKARIENLDCDQVEAELQGGGATLLDLRESEERLESGVIPEAIHAPRGMLEFYADPSLPYHLPQLQPEARIILHCASGGRSALAADLLGQLGYSRVAHLDGGFKAWKQAGKRTASLR